MRNNEHEAGQRFMKKAKEAFGPDGYWMADVSTREPGSIRMTHEKSGANPLAVVEIIHRGGDANGVGTQQTEVYVSPSGFILWAGHSVEGIVHAEATRGCAEEIVIQATYALDGMMQSEGWTPRTHGSAWTWSMGEE